MYACIPVPLKLQTVGGSFADDDEIRGIFRSLGFETRPDESRLDLQAKEVRIGLDSEPVKMVPIGSTAHHRDLGSRNLSGDTPGSIRKEVQKYGIFFGASTIFHAHLYITRVTGGEITIWCRQDSLERLMPFCREIGECLANGPLSRIADLEKLRASKNNFALYSGEPGVIISNGDLQFNRVRSTLASRSSDVVLWLVTLIIWGASFGLHFVPVTKFATKTGEAVSDPLGATFRSFIENCWPAATAALLTITATLTIACLMAPRQQISWSWQR